MRTSIVLMNYLQNDSKEFVLLSSLTSINKFKYDFYDFTISIMLNIYIEKELTQIKNILAKMKFC